MGVPPRCPQDQAEACESHAGTRPCGGTPPVQVPVVGERGCVSGGERLYPNFMKRAEGHVHADRDKEKN